MKILQLRLLNINSFKGEHHIDFENPSLSKAGLFAITGVTGSGKSTLLDAITLALFNKTPRFPIISKEQLRKTKGICTLNTQESYSEVEYLAQGKKYRSKWSINENRNGNLNDYHMELTCLSESDAPMDLKKSKVPEENAKRIGLNFDQFIKSILLSQGEFARLIKSKAKDRGKLLEQITGTVAYRELSKFAFERHKTEKRKYENKTKERDELKSNLLTKEQIISLGAEKDEKTQEITSLEEKGEILRKAIHIKKDLKLKYDELESLKTEQKALEENKQHFLAKQKSLSLHNQLSKELNYDVIKELLESITTQQQQIKACDESIEILQKEKGIGEKGVKQLGESIEGRQEHLTKQLALFEEVITLDSAIKYGQEELDKIQEEFSKASFDVNKKQEELDDEQDILQKITTSLEKIAFFIEQNQLLEEINISIIENHYKQYQQGFETLESSFLQKRTGLKRTDLPAKTLKNINSLEQVQESVQLSLDTLTYELDNFSLEKLNHEEIKELEKSVLKNREKYQKIQDVLQKKSIAFHELEKKLEGLDQNLVTYKKDLQITEQEQKKLTKEIEFKRVDVEQLELDKKRLDLEKKYEEDRKSLVKGDTCPLCGSTEHPYVISYEDRLDEVSQKLIAEKTLLDAYQKKEKELLQNIASVRKDCERFERDLKEGKREKENIQEEFILINNDLKTDYSIIADEAFWEGELKTIASASQEMKELVEQNEKRIDNEQDKKVLLDLLTLAEGIEKDQTTFKNSVDQYSVLLDRVEEQDYIEVLKEKQEHFQEIQKEFIEGETNKKVQIQKVSASQKDVARLKEELKTKRQQRQEKEKTQKELSKNRFDKLENRDPKEEEKVLRTEIEVLQKRLNDGKIYLSERIASLSAKEEEKVRLENEKLISLEKQKNVESSLLQILEKEEIEYSGQLTDIDQYFLDGDILDKIEQEQKNIQEEEQRIITTFKVKQEEFEQKQTENLDERNVEILIEELSKINNELSLLNRKKFKLEKDLQDNEQFKEELEKKNKRLEGIEKEYKKWYSLNEMIGSSDGSKFADFAQELTFTHLIRLANQRLQDLDPRYYLKKVPTDDNKDDVFVVDAFQGDTERSIATLSGGETFLVSLAMALGLSDMASQNVKIESLFIDEGFATLDEDTLDSALNTLEKLQVQTNRTIAVISHVASLKERINTQIQMTKNSSGFSTMKVVES